jgi:hypothetical protein
MGGEPLLHRLRIGLQGLENFRLAEWELSAREVTLSATLDAENRIITNASVVPDRTKEKNVTAPGFRRPTACNRGMKIPYCSTCSAAISGGFKLDGGPQARPSRHLHDRMPGSTVRCAPGESWPCSSHRSFDRPSRGGNGMTGRPALS